jgi:hypothetical protein
VDMDITTEPVVSTSGVARLRAAFPVPTRTDWTVEIQHRADGAVQWENFQVTTEDGEGTSGIVADGIEEIRWRVVGLSGKSSGWLSPVLEYPVISDTNAPVALNAFNVTGGMGNAAITFTTANDDHIRHVDICRVAFGAAFDPDTATAIQRIAVVPSGSYSFTDGDGSSVSTVTDGDFDNPAAWNTAGTTWTVSGGKITHASGNAVEATQAASFVAGTVYRVGFLISGFTAGVFVIRFQGGTEVSTTNQTSNGWKFFELTAATGNNLIAVDSSMAAVGSIDKLIVYAKRPGSLTAGVYDYYAVPRNGSGVDGPVSGPITLAIA